MVAHPHNVMFSAIKRNELLTHMAPWKNLKNNTLNKRSHKFKSVYHKMPLIGSPRTREKLIYDEEIKAVDACRWCGLARKGMRELSAVLLMFLHLDWDDN